MTAYEEGHMSYAEGHMSYAEGYNPGDNPYKEGSDEYRRWDKGWHDAMDIHYEAWEQSCRNL